MAQHASACFDDLGPCCALHKRSTPLKPGAHDSNPPPPRRLGAAQGLQLAEMAASMACKAFTPRVFAKAPRAARAGRTGLRVYSVSLSLVAHREDPCAVRCLRLGPAPPEGLSLCSGASASTMWVILSSNSAPERRRQEISVRLSQRRHGVAELKAAP